MGLFEVAMISLVVCVAYHELETFFQWATYKMQQLKTKEAVKERR